jgi:TrbL/VirB6 plasmid conjugal transfer protein
VVLMGPIFISFGLFEKTSDLLIGWTRQIAHGLVELLFYAVAGKIALNMIGNAESYAGYSGKDLVLAAFGALLGLLVSVVLFFKIPGLASGITGGHQGLTLGQLVAQRALGFAARQAGLVTAAGLGAGQAVTWRGIRGGAWAAGAATGALQGAWTAHRRLGKP